MTPSDQFPTFPSHFAAFFLDKFRLVPKRGIFVSSWFSGSLIPYSWGTANEIRYNGSGLLKKIEVNLPKFNPLSSVIGGSEG